MQGSMIGLEAQLVEMCTDISFSRVCEPFVQLSSLLNKFKAVPLVCIPNVFRMKKGELFMCDAFKQYLFPPVKTQILWITGRAPIIKVVYKAKNLLRFLLQLINMDLHT